MEQAAGDSASPPTGGGHGISRVAFLSILLAVATVGLAVASVAMALHSAYLGDDVRPLLQAGHAVREHKSPYAATFSQAASDENVFVYPPLAAIAVMPLSYLSRSHAESLMVLLDAASLLAIVGVLTWRYVARRWTIALGALAASLVLSSQIAAQTLSSGNVTILLVLPAFWVLELWARDHWRAGALLLAVTLCLKPLLLPLLLIPLVRRRWEAIGLAVLPAVAVSILTGWATGTLSDLPRLLWFLGSGNGLTGSRAAYNISLRAFGEVHGLEPLVFVLRGVVVAAVGYCLWRFATHRATFHVIGWVILLGTFLAGSIGEPHYLFLGLPAVYDLLSQRRLGWIAGACFVGLLLVAVPRGFTGDIRLLQVRQVSTEIVLFVTFVAYCASMGGYSPRVRSRSRIGPKPSDA